jgi:hypothetical protein
VNGDLVEIVSTWRIGAVWTNTATTVIGPALQTTRS